MPQSDLSGPEKPPTASNADARSWMVAMLRGCARAGALLSRLALNLDASMGKFLVARNLRTEGRSQALSLIGSGAILIAAFAPLMNVPVVGSVTYFNGNSNFALGAGVALIMLGIASLILALIEKYLWLYPVGFSSLLIAIGTIVSWKWYVARSSNAPSPPAAGLLDYFTQSASKGIIGHSSLSFGLPLLIYGAVLVMIAALLRPREELVTYESQPG